MKKVLLSCLFIISMVTHAQISLGTGSTSTGPAPVSNYYGYSYVQQIFTKHEINANASGNITGLKFYLDPTASLVNSSNWTVFIAHTTKTNFSSEDDWIPVSQLTQVFSGNVDNNNGVVEITFPIPFFYNNMDNLVIAAKENDSGYDGSSEAFYVYDAAPFTSLYFRSDFINPDPSSPSLGTMSEQKSVITFEGLTANTTPPCPTITYPSDQGTFVSLNPNIKWLAVPGATQYKISVGTTPGGTNVVNEQITTATNYTPSINLSPNTLYYVKLKTISSAGESIGCGDFTFTTAPPVPSNDQCSSAVSLTVNPDLNCGNMKWSHNFGASDSGITPDPCYGLPDNDVWFKFTATSTSHFISLHDVQSVGGNYSTDTDFQIFSGDCNGLMNLMCSDFSSSLVSGLTIGETYYMRVYSYWGAGHAQSFNVCVGTPPPAPANDECSNALTVTSFPFVFNQSDGAGATNNNGFITVCPNNDMNDGTWFTLIGTGENIRISVSMPNDSSFDPKIGVYSGNCSGLSCEGTADEFTEGGAETLNISTVAGKKYYINVGNYSGYTDYLEGSFTISIAKNILATSESWIKKDQVKIYPNPFTDILHISEATDIKSISITDLSGRLIKTIHKPSSVLDVKDLKQGMYLFILHKKDGSSQSVKIIKQ